MNKLKLLDLFSGIGGFSLGLESTGYFETIGFVEKDKFCHEVLKKNFPNITIESEVRNVKGSNYKADIITGGFPCQPFSVAGKRRGTDDDRYLWDETIRIIKETKPRWFIGENVEGIINIQDGMVLRQVQDDLEKEGFEVQCLVIPASSIGAWHQRKRVWIVANSKHNGSHRQERNETIEIIKMYPTPTQDSANERQNKYKQGGMPLPLAVKMLPTPNATNINTPQSDRVEQVKSGGFILRKKNKPHMTYGARLQDVMHHLDNKPGGKLNPEFVEFLMGYPLNWTKIERTE